MSASPANAHPVAPDAQGSATSAAARTVTLRYFASIREAIGSGQERSDFVGCAVDCGRFAGRGTVEDVDERPAEVLGIGLERSPRDHRKEIGPDRFESLYNRIVARKIIGGNRGRTNRKTGKIEAGKLVRK